MNILDNHIKKGIIIGIALILAASILGLAFYQAQKPQNTIKVVGVASKKFEADTVKWSIALEEETGPDSLKKGFEKLNKQINMIVNELTQMGLSEENITRKPVNVMKEYDFKEEMGMRRRIFKGYRLHQNLYIISDKVKDIEELAFNPIPLMEKEVIIRNSNLQYYSSKIDNLKKEIIAEATLNAKERAKKMIQSSNIKLGKILSIKSGVFQITEPYSTRVSSSGIYDTSTRKKQIRVTVHASFEIK